MKTEVRTVKEILANAARTIRNTERALMGGLDDSGTQWVEGIREKVTHVDEKVDGLKRQSAEDLADVKTEISDARLEVRGGEESLWAHYDGRVGRGRA